MVVGVGACVVVGGVVCWRWCDNFNNNNNTTNTNNTPTTTIATQITNHCTCLHACLNNSRALVRAGTDGLTTQLPTQAI